MLDAGHYGPAVVIAQSAVEVGMARAISFGLSGDVPDALQTWIEEPATVGTTWSPRNPRVKDLWTAVTGDTITEADGWPTYKPLVKELRHGSFTKPDPVPKDDAEQFIDAAAKVVTHIARVMSAVALRKAASES